MGFLVGFRVGFLDGFLVGLREGFMVSPTPQNRFVGMGVALAQ